MFAETMRSFQGSNPVRYYIYEVQPLGEDGTAELAVSETVHREIQITRPARSDMCTLYKKITKNGRNMNAIQFPDVNHLSLPTNQPHQEERAVASGNASYKLQAQGKDTKSMESAIIATSWAMNFLGATLLSDFAGLFAAENKPGQHAECRQRINDRIAMVISIRDQEAKKYYESLHNANNVQSDDIPLPSEPKPEITQSGINLNDIPF